MLNQDFKEFIQSLNANQVVDFATCYPLRIQVEVDGVLVDFIDVDNLKKNKRAVGRLQDLADLENLKE